MTEFKVGDQVELQEKYGTYQVGHRGTVLDVEDSGDPDETLLRVDSAPNGWIFAHHVRLAEPRKDTPRVGDTVRVVLEGKVTHVSGYGFDMVAQNTIPFSPENAEHVKSIEIITPAKPSVKDLPVGSVVKSDAGSVYQKVAPGDWRKAGFSSARPDAEIHLIGWTLLVEKAGE